jgi:hypothetical protein
MSPGVTLRAGSNTKAGPPAARPGTVPGPAPGAKPPSPERRAAKQGQRGGSGSGALPAGGAPGRQRTSGGGASKAGKAGEEGPSSGGAGTLELPELPGAREGGFRLPARRANSSPAGARGRSTSRRPTGAAGRSRSRDASPGAAQPPAAPASAAALVAAATTGARSGAEVAREFFGAGSLAKGIDWASTLQAAACSEESAFQKRGFSPNRPAPGGPWPCWWSAAGGRARMLRYRGPARNSTCD